MTPRHFAWQAWRNLTSTFVLRGRGATNSHPPSFRVAGVALMALSGALGLGLVAREARGTLRGRRGTISHPPSFCVASVAQTHTHLRFAWQAWHNLTSTFVLRGRRGAISHPPSFRVAGVALMALSGALGFGLVARDARDAAALCVAGVAQSHIHLRFAWQAWDNLTSTFVCVAGVALMPLPRASKSP